MRQCFVFQMWLLFALFCPARHADMLSAQRADVREPEGLNQVRLFRISENEHYGFIDQTGKVAIAPRFSYVWPFSDGLARVIVTDDVGDERQGFIDSSGQFAIGPGSPTDLKVDGRRCRYLDFQDGLAGLWMLDADSLGGYIDKRGRVIIPLQFQFFGSFAEGLAGVSIPAEDFRGPAGLIGRTGEFVIAPVGGRRFDSEFRNGLCAVFDYSTDKYGFIDRKGHIVIPSRYDEVYDFAEERACVVDKSNRPWEYGFIDCLGDDVVPIELDYASSRFVNGLACVIKNKSTWIIDRSGKILRTVNLELENVREFVDGVARVQLAEDGLYGFINENGEPIIPPQYDRADSFHLGLARVRKGNVTGYINRENTFVWKTTAWAKW